MTASAIYHGTIRHRRAAPAFAFRHKLSLVYLDLDELPALLDGRLLRRGPGTLRFRRDDYLEPHARALATAVRERVAALTGIRADGPIRMLTQLRSFGVCFNPVSFYYCIGRDGRLQAVLAEVTNTPWGERHSYALSDVTPGSSVVTGTFDKRLHVSPFLAMDHVYEARVTTPGPTLSVHITSRQASSAVFDATLNLRRAELTRDEVRRMIVRQPLGSARVLALIYRQALGLRLAGARYHPHPGCITTA